MTDTPLPGDGTEPITNSDLDILQETATAEKIDPGQGTDSSWLDKASQAWEGIARLWQVFRQDQVTPLRLASHGALLLIAVLLLVLSQVKLPDWELVRVAAPVSAESEQPPDPPFVREPIGGSPLQESGALLRAPVPFTTIPDRPRTGVISYTVQLDDTVLSIAERFNLSTSTVIWANLEDLSQPFFMEVGQALLIPPVDGVLHTVADKDTLESIAKKYKSTVEKIVGYPENGVADASAPLIPGSVLIVPDGDRTPPTPPAVARFSVCPLAGRELRLAGLWPADPGLLRLSSRAGHRRAAGHHRARRR